MEPAGSGVCKARTPGDPRRSGWAAGRAEGPALGRGPAWGRPGEGDVKSSFSTSCEQLPWLRAAAQDGLRQQAGPTLGQAAPRLLSQPARREETQQRDSRLRDAGLAHGDPQTLAGRVMLPARTGRQSISLINN